MLFILSFVLIIQAKSPVDTASVNRLIRSATDLMDSRPDSALALAEEALRLSVLYGHGEGEAFARSRRGIALHVTGQPGGYRELEQALDLFQKVDNRSEYGWTLLNLANLDSDRGDLVGGARRLQEALDLFTAIQLKHGMASTMLNLVEIRIALNQLEQAFTLTQQALELYDHLDAPREKALALLRMGTVQTLRGNLIEAIPLLHHAVTIAERRQDFRMAGNALEGLGQAHQRLGQYAEALFMYRRSLEFRERIDDRNGLVGSRVGIAKMMLRLGDAHGALPIALIAYREAGILNLPNARSKSANVLYEIQKSKGWLAEAITYLEEHQRIQADLFALDKAKAIANLEAISELKAKDAEIGALQQQRILERVVLALVVALLVVSILFMNLAINSRKKAHDLAEQLDRVGKQKDHVLSILSHDLRGPMVSMSSLVDLIDMEIITPDDWKRLKPSLIRQFDGTSETLQDLLLWAKGQFEGVNPHIQSQSLHDAVHVSEELLDIVAKQKGIRIANDVSPDAMVRCERSHLLTIIRNLVTNAVKFSHPGQTVTIQDGITDGMRIVSIRDEGVGMSPERRDSLFETTGQSTQGTTGEGGSGLGLMFVRDLVQRNGGRIHVESTPGIGSVFTVALPMG